MNQPIPLTPGSDRVSRRGLLGLAAAGAAMLGLAGLLMRRRSRGRERA